MTDPKEDSEEIILDAVVQVVSSAPAPAPPPPTTSLSRTTTADSKESNASSGGDTLDALPSHMRTIGPLGSVSRSSTAPTLTSSAPTTPVGSRGTLGRGTRRLQPRGLRRLDNRRNLGSVGGSGSGTTTTTTTATGGGSQRLLRPESNTAAARSARSLSHSPPPPPLGSPQSMTASRQLHLRHTIAGSQPTVRPGSTARPRSNSHPVAGGRGPNNNNGAHDANNQKEYALRSITRGSDDWKTLLKPFVSDLCFRSVKARRYETEHASHAENHHSSKISSFRPYHCQAALLFVDLSGYSRITTVLAPQGAHVISHAVNSYLARLIAVICKHDGDVIKFAGDALMAVWEGDEQDLECNVWAAARCVVEMQETAGEHEVLQGHVLRIHCGLCCGPLESEVFEAPQHAHMQRLFHAVGGSCMTEIGDLVDAAKSGETCISENVANFLEDLGSYQDVPAADNPGGAKLLKGLHIDEELEELVNTHVERLRTDRAKLRTQAIEEDFIHSSVLANLLHGGLSPTQIAQMRHLCVLFIGKTSQGDAVNWLLETQAILDDRRCPIVQIIDDDKGVHLVAAVNLYEAVPEAPILGLQVCRDLARKRVGAAVGMAVGPVFCGVTGSIQACRWDITGAAVVRAARLMQLAVAREIDFCIDSSVHQDPMAAIHLTMFDPGVEIKGSPDPVPVYTMAETKSDAAFRIQPNIHAGVHSDKVQAMQNHISVRDRSAVVVTGIPLAGKKIACQRAAGYSDLVPFLHLSDNTGGFLQLARTIATWFSYIDSPEIQQSARHVMADMDAARWSFAHDSCIHLVDLALQRGYRACFLVDRIQFLDKFSISLIRSCVRRDRPRQDDPRGTHHTTASAASSANATTKSHSDSLSDSSFRKENDDLDVNAMELGKICFLCVHTALYNGKSALEVVEDIQRSHSSFTVPIVKVGEASRDELVNLCRDLMDLKPEDRFLDAFQESSGSCAGYFIERLVAVRNLSAPKWKNAEPALTETSDDLLRYIPQGLVRRNKELAVSQIRPEIAMRFSQLYDELPPLCQMVIKIVTIATRQGFYRLPRPVLLLVMNDLIEQGVEKDVLIALLNEMTEISLLKMELLAGIQPDGADFEVFGEGDNFEISVQNPALADVAFDVCTPVQVRSIATALIERLGETFTDNFEVSLVAASLHKLLGQNVETMKLLWLQAYQGFLEESEWLSDADIDKWMEIIDDEIRAAGYESQKILGSDFLVPVPKRSVMPPSLSMLHSYVAPVAFGPMGQTLSVICRNTFHEYGAFQESGPEELVRVQSANSGACGRYMMEISVLEDFLREYGLGAAHSDLEWEFDTITFITNPGEGAETVATKAMMISENIVPNFVEPRLGRLRQLVRKLRTDPTLETPAVMETAEVALRRAYQALQGKGERVDAAQDALMILATLNWKPRRTHESLPLTHTLTVAHVREKVLRRLNKAECILFRHQQSVDDLGAFLLTTAILNQASAQGLC